MKTSAIVLSLLLLPSVAHAQRVVDTRSGALVPVPLTEPKFTAVAMPTVRNQRKGAMIATGTVFAIAGLLGGAWAGEAVACGDGHQNSTYCGFDGAILGALAGEGLMLPMGVHHVSNRSSYGEKAKLSFAMMLGGMILAPVTGGLSILAIPPVQLAMIIRAENRAPDKAP